MDASERAAAARELDDLAGGWGVPAAVQFAADRLPDSVTADVAYDFSLAVGLLIGDLAEVLDTVDDTIDDAAAGVEPEAAPHAEGEGS